MKYLLLSLLPLALAACNPLGTTDDDGATTSKPAAKSVAKTATPTPPPKPGAWMQEKKIGNKLSVQEDRLGVKGNRLDEPAKKK